MQIDSHLVINWQQKAEEIRCVSFGVFQAISNHKFHDINLFFWHAHFILHQIHV